MICWAWSGSKLFAKVISTWHYVGKELIIYVTSPTLITKLSKPWKISMICRAWSASKLFAKVISTWHYVGKELIIYVTSPTLITKLSKPWKISMIFLPLYKILWLFNVLKAGYKSKPEANLNIPLTPKNWCNFNFIWSQNTYRTGNANNTGTITQKREYFSGILFFSQVFRRNRCQHVTKQSRDKMPLYFKTITAVNSTYINTLSVWLSK